MDEWLVQRRMWLLLPMKLARAVVILILPVLGCDTGSSPFGDVASRIPSPAQEEAIPKFGLAVRIPAISCVKRVAETVAVHEIAGLPPANRARESRNASPQVKDWLPKNPTRVVPTARGFAVLDAGAKELNLFSRDFTRRTRSHAKDHLDSTAATLVRPVTAAVNTTGDTIWVLDSPPRLVAFDAAGRFVRAIALPNGGQQLALDRDGNFYVGRIVLPQTIRRDTSARESVMVAVYDRDGAAKPPLVKVAAKDLTLPRFNLPGPTDVILSSRDSYVAVAFPAAGVVDLYQKGKLLGTAQMCLPPGVVAAYGRQLAAATEETRQQSWVPFISDVYIHPNGDLSVMSNVADREGRYHLDRFTSHGESRASVIFAKSWMRLPFPVSFASGEHTLVGFQDDGGIVTLELRRLQ